MIYDTWSNHDNLRRLMLILLVKTMCYTSFSACFLQRCTNRQSDTCTTIHESSQRFGNSRVAWASHRFSPTWQAPDSGDVPVLTATVLDSSTDFFRIFCLSSYAYSLSCPNWNFEWRLTRTRRRVCTNLSKAFFGRLGKSAFSAFREIIRPVWMFIPPTP